MPHNVRKLKHYVDPVPLFTRFQIESQIESAFAHAVTLPSGGSIVIDHTEALVSIDINSARATKGGDIEATALNTNLEAADEIARQLRIRDLGGLVVIDFIDMGPQKNQRAVENRLREAVRQDRARVQIGKITRFGLLEMSRQRLRPSLGESSYHTCPRCSGFGTIRSVESLALAILRIVGEEARKERTVKVIAQLPVEVATYLLNEKRDWVRSVETRHDTQVVLVANSALETPHYDVRRVRDDQAELPENAGVSYTLVEAEPEPDVPTSMQERQAAEQAAIGKIEPISPAPKRKEPAEREKPGKPESGFWGWLKSLFTGDEEQKKEPATKRKASSSRRRKPGSDDRKRSSQQRGQRRDDSRSDGGRRSKKKPSKKKTRKSAAKKSTGGQREQQKAKQDTRKDESREDSRRSSRNRRSRGGRRRRRSDDRPAQASESSGGSAAKAEAPQQEQQAQAKRSESKPRQAPEKRKDAHADATPVKKSEAKPQEPKAKKEKPESPPEAKPEPRPEAKAEPKAEAKAEAKQPAEAKRKPKAESAGDSGNGSSEKPGADKPEGRLLPWEPTHPPMKVENEPPKEAKQPKQADVSAGAEAPQQD
jgi:ribonuclease E